MRCAALAFAGLSLVACDTGFGTGMSVGPDRQAAFVALVEQSGCRVDAADHEYVHAAGFTDPEIAEIGGQLAAEGRAEITAGGDLILTSGMCI
jgi:hypothetical protein